jgi:hypothetical protein
MGALDPRLARALDELTPPRPGPEAWDAIVDAAGGQRRAQRPWLVRLLPVAGAAVAAILLALAWPFGGGRSGTILERAAAAVGDGPVLHAVIRSGWGGTLVDLDSGAREEIRGELEVWYDPERGIHEISRFAGVLQGEALYPPRRVSQLDSYLEKTLSGLATGYRDALQNGTAYVLESGVVEGQAVHWIRVDTQMLPDVADNKLHEWAHDVAVSQDTFEPVATRETRDRKLGPDGISIVLSVETLPQGEGSFTRIAPEPAVLVTRVGFTGSGSLTPSEASSVLGHTALWAGQRVAGLDLTRIWKDERAEGYDRGRGAWEKTFTGVTFLYGPTDENGNPTGERFLRLSESTTLDSGFRWGVRNFVPPEGSMLVLDGGRASLRKDGVYVALSASSEDILLSAARSLEPVPTD